MVVLLCVLLHTCKCRVLDEISEVLGDREFVTAEDIEQLQYMEQVRVYGIAIIFSYWYCRILAFSPELIMKV